MHESAFENFRRIEYNRMTSAFGNALQSGLHNFVHQIFKHRYCIYIYIYYDVIWIIYIYLFVLHFSPDINIDNNKDKYIFINSKEDHLLYILNKICLYSHDFSASTQATFKNVSGPHLPNKVI